METPSRDEMVLRLSRTLDQWAEECLGDDPDWGPLEAAIPREWCGGFMWMNRIEAQGVVIELYKHGITRRYLKLDAQVNAYRYTGDGYEQIPLGEALDHVFDGLEEMGFSRETDYDEEFIRRKHEALRAAGWTVVSTASLDAENIPDGRGPGRPRASAVGHHSIDCGLPLSEDTPWTPFPMPPRSTP